MRLRYLALACVVLGGCRSADAPPAPMPPAVVVASPLVIRLTEWDEYTGLFEATDTVDVRARVDGYLDSIHFRDGTIVKPGDLLFVIDPRPYEAVSKGRAQTLSARRHAWSSPRPTSLVARRCSRSKASARKSSTPGRRRGRKPRRP